MYELRLEQGSAIASNAKSADCGDRRLVAWLGKFGARDCDNEDRVRLWFGKVEALFQGYGTDVVIDRLVKKKTMQIFSMIMAANKQYSE